VRGDHYVDAAICVFYPATIHDRFWATGQNTAIMMLRERCVAFVQTKPHDRGGLSYGRGRVTA
jgi:hypothetical protein